MADENDGASKTEDATPRKLEEARAKGDVAKSIDLAQVASLAGAFVVLIIMGGWLARDMAERLTVFFARPETMQLQGAGGVQVAQYAIMAAAPAMAAVLGATMIS